MLPRPSKLSAVLDRRDRQMSGIAGWIQDRLATRTRGGRAKRFADRYFLDCPAHSGEGAAVYRALERLSARPSLAITPDVAVADIVGHAGSIPLRGLDSVEIAELVAALETAWDVRRSSAEEPAIAAVLSVVLSRWLLGPAIEAVRWDPETIWSRSVRGIINERVRRSGGCPCSNQAPSNKRPQPTSGAACS